MWKNRDCLFFKQNKGFTLIELLAVIVILAIIALIAIPLTISVINKAEENSFKNTAYGLIDGVKLLSIEQQFKDESISSEVVVNFVDGVADNTNFKVSGDVPKSGTVHLNNEGKTELKIWSEDLGKCVEKTFTNSKVEFTETAEDDCRIEIIVFRSFGEVMSQSLETMTNDPGGNRRYVGVDPNNYVKFNNELWRIIGVFDGQAKIIRNDFYSTSMKWDSNDPNNDWSQATLQTELNGTYLDSIEETSKSYIDTTHVWNLGGIANYASTTRGQSYELERGTSVYSGRPTTWTGTIGLMYPSDYGYATSSTDTTCDSTTMYDWGSGTAKTECAQKSWLYSSNTEQWTLTPRSDSFNDVFYVTRNGAVSYDYVIGNIGDIYSGETNPFGVRPVLFLKSDVKIASGSGSQNDPFILEA